jgi:ABC-2 type transport system permease protein
MKALMIMVRMGLWQRRWFILWWSLGITAFVVLNLSFYPSFKDRAVQLNESFANLPEGVVDLFSDTGDFLSPVGYLSSQIYYLLLPLLFSVAAIGLGGSLLAREERQGTLELLLARPVSRTKLLLAKMLCGLISMLLIGAVVTLAAALLIKTLDFGVSMRFVALTTIVALLLSLVFGALAFALTAMGRMARIASLGVASLVGFAGYLLTSLSGTIHWLEWPARLLPYYYYHPSGILQGRPNWPGIIGLAAALLVLAVIAWAGFRRRDIG